MSDEQWLHYFPHQLFTYSDLSCIPGCSYSYTILFIPSLLHICAEGVAKRRQIKKYENLQAQKFGPSLDADKLVKNLRQRSLTEENQFLDLGLNYAVKWSQPPASLPQLRPQPSNLTPTQQESAKSYSPPNHQKVIYQAIYTEQPLNSAKKETLSSSPQIKVTSQLLWIGRSILKNYLEMERRAHWARIL